VFKVRANQPRRLFVTVTQTSVQPLVVEGAVTITLQHLHSAFAPKTLDMVRP
jgi:hypothetical protein